MHGTVVVTASTDSFPGVVEALRAIPVAVEVCPLMTFAPPLDWSPVDAAARDLSGFGAVAFTSPRSARAFVGRVQDLDAATRERTSVWAAGSGTAQALGQTLGAVRRPDDRAVGRQGAALALAEAMVAERVRGPVLFPCGDIRRDELPARLRDGGIEVVEVVVYRSVLAGEVDARRGSRAGAGAGGGEPQRGRPARARLPARRPASPARRGSHHRRGRPRLRLAAGGRGRQAHRRGTGGRRADADGCPLNRIGAE